MALTYLAGVKDDTIILSGNYIWLLGYLSLYIWDSLSNLGLESSAHRFQLGIVSQTDKMADYQSNLEVFCLADSTQIE